MGMLLMCQLSANRMPYLSFTMMIMSHFIEVVKNHIRLNGCFKSFCHLIKHTSVSNRFLILDEDIQ